MESRVRESPSSGAGRARVEDTASGGATPSTRYHLVTSILEPARAPADELAVLYHKGGEMETAFGELTCHRSREIPQVAIV